MTEFEQQLKDVLSQAYDIERELGGGGMSRVFVATDRVLGRKIVIKLLSPELIADVNRGRFRREIQVAAQLQHPHIVPLLSAGEHEDLLYFTMPFIAGESLKQSLERNGPMLVPDVIRALYHVGEALDYAHAAGVVHRDIKPANILRSGNYALVTDFGVAKALNASMASSGMTSTGMAIGTPMYMAPEQLAGDPQADHRIDIYALGLLAYELLNGRSPFAASTPQRVLAAVLTQDAPPLIDVRPDVPRALSDAVMACLSKDPEMRPKTAKAVLAMFDGLSTSSGETKTQERRAVPRVQFSTPESYTPSVNTPASNRPVSSALGSALSAAMSSAPTPSTPVTNTPVANTPVSNTPASNTPVTNTPVSNTPVTNAPVSFTPTDEQFAVTEEPAPGDVPAFDGYEPPKKKSKGTLIGALAVIAVLAAGAIYFATRSSAAPTVVASPPNASLAVTDSLSVQPPVAAATALPATTDSAANAAVTPKLDSAAVVDSIRKAAAAKKLAAAKADSLKKVAAKADSMKRAQGSVKTKVRFATIAFLGDATALEKFTSGATHMGGVLGKQRRGDLQKQIDALTPFLSKAGITYAEFKAVAQESGVNLFDEYGRMLPDSLKRLTGISFGR